MTQYTDEELKSLIASSSLKQWKADIQIQRDEDNKHQQVINKLKKFDSITVLKNKIKKLILQINYGSRYPDAKRELELVAQHLDETEETGYGRVNKYTFEGWALAMAIEEGPMGCDTDSSVFLEQDPDSNEDGEMLKDLIDELYKRITK